MRSAKAGDYWRRVESRTFKSYIKSISFSNSSLLGGLEIVFQAGISVICGGNGVGKSQIASILSYLTNSELSSGILSVLPEEVDAEVTYVESEVDKTSSLNYSKGFAQVDDRPLISKFINPSEYATLVRRILSQEDALGEYLEQFEAISLKDNERKNINHILRKEYESIEIITTDHVERNLPVPYFRLKIGELIYGSESMGMGELCALVIFWVYKTMDDGTTLILEEPENFLMYGAQDDIADYIAKQASERSINTILITHSPAILNKISPSRVSLVYSEGGRARLIQKPTITNLSDYTGYKSVPTKFLYVEDRIAEMIVSTAISKILPSSSIDIKLSIAGDNSKLDLLSQAAAIISFGKTFVIYDGDCSSDPKRSKTGLFLFGQSSPEFEIVKSVKKRVAQTSKHLSITKQSLEMAIHAHAGTDDHEIIGKIANTIGVDYKVCISSFISQHVDDQKSFYKHLVNKINNI